MFLLSAASAARAVLPSSMTAVFLMALLLLVVMVAPADLARLPGTDAPAPTPLPLRLFLLLINVTLRFTSSTECATKSENAFCLSSSGSWLAPSTDMQALSTAAL